MMKLAPIVVFVYSRPEHTKELLTSLSNCKLAKESVLYIFSDAAKNENSKDKVEAVRKIIHSEEWEKYFYKINIQEANKNKGLANSVISGVTQVINMHGRVIVVEDDNRVAPDFLDYMNRALQFYEDNKKIGEIGGYCAPIKFPKDYNHDVFAMGRGSSYAWATWKDRWECIDWEVKDFETIKNDKKMIKEFNEYGEDMFTMLKGQVCGHMDSWAIRSAYSKFKEHTLCIMPVKTRVENQGFDGTGIHNVAADTRFIVNIEKNLKPVIFENVDVDPRIKKEFVKQFRVPIYIKIKRKVKQILSIK